MDKLPKSLRISDPKVLARAEEMEKELGQRANSPFANLSPAEHQRARAITIANELKRDLGEVRKMLKEERTEGLEAAERALSAQLAEQYAITGRFDLAADVHPDPAQKESYKEILKAINKDDAIVCGCPPGRDFVVQDIWSMRHCAIVSLIKCSGCGTLNARPLPAHLAQQRGFRSKARALAEHLSPEEAKSVLEREGHTAKKLL